jgi:hypothetical protein
MDVKKSIVKTVWLTILTMFLLTIIACVVFVFIFTKQCADFMYDIGCNNIASVLYHKSYVDDGEIGDCYKALNIKIALGENDKIIEYYEDFIADEEYESFMSAGLQNSEMLDISVLEKSAILNDRNYLVNNYVKALIATEQVDKAKAVALVEFQGYATFNFKNQGVYALGQLVSSNSEFFNTQHEGYNDVLVEEMQVYFDKLINIFDNYKSVESNLDKSYLVALGNRLINVGQDINSVYNTLEVKEDIVSSNVSKMLIVNNVIKGII